MAKIAIKDNSGSDDQVVSPTQAQMDDWIEQELQEAADSNMLSDEAPITIFSEADVSGESID